MTADPLTFFVSNPSQNHLFAINSDQSAEVLLESASCLLQCAEDLATHIAVDEDPGPGWPTVYFVQMARAIVEATRVAIDRERGPRPPALVPTGA
jgi:hypothetical protein